MEEFARPNFGSRIKRLREERGVTLRRIADATKISTGALEALERNNISRLPGGIYSRAFVRLYAIEIGLDPEQAVREFLVQFPHDSVTVGSLDVPFENDITSVRRRWWIWTMVALVAISLLVAAILFLAL